MRWDRDGRQLFSAGVHTQRKDGPPGGFSNIRSILGQPRGNIVVRDACAPATVWTPDGLYAGTFYRPRPGRPKEDEDGQPVPNQYDDAQDVQVIETPKGEVLWGCNDVQNTLVYRIHGWDGWQRQSGQVALASAAIWTFAVYNFSPLATYFSEATFNRMDPKLREGFLDAARKAAVDTRAHGLEMEKEALRNLVDKGVTIVECDKEAFRKRVLPQTDNFIKARPEAKPVVDMIRATQA
jgi:hypothetical protein